MKRFLLPVLVFALISISFPPKAQAAMPPKAKAFLLVAGYGAASGALLGFASMAFGTSSRAIAQGASLGLYAGLLFGTYVVVSHGQRRDGYYDDKASPYRDSTEYYDPTYPVDSPSGQGGYFDSGVRRGKSPFQVAMKYRELDSGQKNSRLNFYLPVLNYSF